MTQKVVDHLSMWKVADLRAERCFTYNQPLFETSTSTYGSLGMAKIWLNTCVSCHLKCTSEDHADTKTDCRSFLPTRLIDVGANDHHTRLCDRVQIDSESKYMTLSHCWGRKMPKRLLTEDLPGMKQSIVINELPKTFQDAITVARYLGVRYLWIDSLCIIQDSEQDWERESSLMSQVYSGSYCNIAATAASDGSRGLFFERDTKLIRPIKVMMRNTFYNIVDGGLWVRNVEQAPLNRRAWVTQERILAPRTIHFALKQLFWECSGTTACESFPEEFPSFVRTSSRSTYTPDVVLRVPRIPNTYSKRDVYDVWDPLLKPTLRRR